MSAFPSAPLAHVFLCLYDTAVVFLEACQALVKYGLHVSERWHAAQAERVRMIFWIPPCSRLAACTLAVSCLSEQPQHNSVLCGADSFYFRQVQARRHQARCRMLRNLQCMVRNSVSSSH